MQKYRFFLFFFTNVPYYVFFQGDVWFDYRGIRDVKVEIHMLNGKDVQDLVQYNSTLYT